MTVAVTDPAAGKRGITCFLCPPGRGGYRVVRKESKLGHRTNDTCRIAFDGLGTGDKDVLGTRGGGARHRPRAPVRGTQVSASEASAPAVKADRP